jgi:hypothetical protein
LAAAAICTTGILARRREESIVISRWVCASRILGRPFCQLRKQRSISLGTEGTIEPFNPCSACKFNSALRSTSGGILRCAMRK